MRTLVESLRRLYINGKVTELYIKNNEKLTEKEKKYILG